MQRTEWFFDNAGQSAQRPADSEGGGISYGFQLSGTSLRPGLMVHGAYHAPEYGDVFASYQQLRTVPLRVLGTTRVLTDGKFGMTVGAGFALTVYEKQPNFGFTEHFRFRPSQLRLRSSLTGTLLCHYELMREVQLMLAGTADYGTARDRLQMRRLAKDDGLPDSRFRPGVLMGVVVGL